MRKTDTRWIKAWLILQIPTSLLDAWAIAKLWHWFIVPKFGLHDLSLYYALGISYLVNFLTHKYRKIEDDDFWHVVIDSITSPLFFVSYGWILHLIWGPK